MKLTTQHKHKLVISKLIVFVFRSKISLLGWGFHQEFRARLTSESHGPCKVCRLATRACLRPVAQVPSCDVACAVRKLPRGWRRLPGYTIRTRNYCRRQTQATLSELQQPHGALIGSLGKRPSFLAHECVIPGGGCAEQQSCEWMICRSTTTNNGTPESRCPRSLFRNKDAREGEKRRFDVCSQSPLSRRRLLLRLFVVDAPGVSESAGR